MQKKKNLPHSPHIPPRTPYPLHYCLQPWLHLSYFPHPSSLAHLLQLVLSAYEEFAWLRGIPWIKRFSSNSNSDEGENVMVLKRARARTNAHTLHAQKWIYIHIHTHISLKHPIKKMTTIWDHTAGVTICHMWQNLQGVAEKLQPIPPLLIAAS